MRISILEIGSLRRPRGVCRTAIFAVTVFPAAALAQSPNRPIPIPHPQPQFRLINAPLTTVDRSSVVSDEMAAFLSRLTQRRSVAYYPSHDSVTTQPLTQATAAVIIDGKLLLLDAQVPHIHVLDLNASTLAGVRGGGRGEPLLSHPVAMAVDAQYVYIADLNLRVSRWRFDGNHFTPVDTIVTLNAEPKGVCVLDKIVLTHELPFEDSATIYSYEPNGVSSSFGVVYRSESTRVNFSARTGILSCAQTEETGPLVIWGAQALLREIRAYSPDGKAKWILRIDTVNGPEFAQVGIGSRTIIPPDGFQRLETLIPAGRWLIAQFAEVTPDNYNAPALVAPLRTFLIDMATGQGVEAPLSIPPILAATETHLVTRVPGPLARIEVLQY